MTVSAKKIEGTFRIVGDWGDTEQANAFLGHLDTRAFSPSTVRSYAFDIVNFARFLSVRGSALVEVSPMMVFDWIEWQGVRAHGGAAVSGAVRTAAASTANRRVAAVRALFEYLVMAGACPSNPVPSPRRRSSPGASIRGLLGHLGSGRSRGGGRLVRQPQMLPESLPVSDVDRFLRSLDTYRDRAIVLVMLLGGLRAAEVRGLQLSDVDLGHRRLRVVGKGSKERHIPVDGAFFTEVAAYLRYERPTGVKSSECFLVLRGPTTGQPLTEAGLRGVFRRHREASGAIRVRPHRLRHTYGTELASAGIDLLALRELMGHVSPDTTARYVHLSIEHLAAEYGAARATLAASAR